MTLANLKDGDTARASEAMLREALMKTRGCECAPGNAPCLRCTALSGSSGEWLERQLSEAVAAERERAEKAEATWRCFHCGFKTDDAKVAEAHFGDVDEEEPICRSWERMNADEKVGAFQGALQEIASEQEENSQLRSKLEKAEAERDGLAAMMTRQKDCPACVGTGYVTSYADDGFPEGDPCEMCQRVDVDPVAILAARDARITAEARRKALLEVYERVKNLRGCNAYDVIDSIEEMSKETTNG